MIITAEIAPLHNMLTRPLTIPSYQRPYRWKTSHVSQLIDDLLAHRSKAKYRLGTVVLHKHRTSDIVDGQQRLLTLTILCQALKPQCAQQLIMLRQRFKSPVSILHLQQNATFIRRRIAQLSEADRTDLAEFLVHRCELACITLNDLSEAFQFFDSQNTRGKDLYPHDLLKAFHLRQMDGEDEDTRIAVVAKWEDEVRRDTRSGGRHGLRAVLGEVLFPLRRWTAGESGMVLTRADLRTFKGVDLGDVHYPSTDALRLLDTSDGAFPFQIDQTLINGRRFFEYVHRYLDLYRTLFVSAHPVVKPYLEMIHNYKGHTRTGDCYVRNLFYSTLLYYYDKFGEEGLADAVKLCFVWSFRYRLSLYRVERESIDNAGCAPRGLIRAIRNAIYPYEVLTYMVPPLTTDNLATNKDPYLLALFGVMGYYNED